MHNIQRTAEILGNKPVNIDDWPINVKALLGVNEDSYFNYAKSCHTSTESKRPNYQIILEDIMGIKTDQDYCANGIK